MARAMTLRVISILPSWLSGGHMDGEFSLIPDDVWRRIRFCRRVNAVVEHLRKHPGPITLGQAAGIACMERTSFCRLFRKRVGVGFSDFLAEYRTELAMKRMLESDASLKEIAADVGFGSFATFQRRFTRATGLSPSAYRAHQFDRRPGVVRGHPERERFAGTLQPETLSME